MHSQIMTPKQFCFLSAIIILIAVIFACATTKAQASEPTPPLSAVAVVQCNQFMAVFFTMADGKMIVVDGAHHEGMSDDAVKVMIEKSTKHMILTMDCTDVGHDSVR